MWNCVFFFILLSAKPLFLYPNGIHKGFKAALRQYLLVPCWLLVTETKPMGRHLSWETALLPSCHKYRLKLEKYSWAAGELCCHCFQRFFLKINLFILFIYFWLCWVFVAAYGLSLVVASRGYSSLQCMGFSLRWLFLLWSTGSRRTGFISCGSWALELRLSSSGALA